MNDFFPLVWRIDLTHIPFTSYPVWGQVGGIPTLGLYYLVFATWFVYVIGAYIYSKQKYGRYLYTIFGLILIGGKFNSGKTRLLTQFAYDTYKKKDVFIISNYYNAYSFLSYSSFKDFCLILEDLLLLGEYQNFTDDESKEIASKFPAYFDKEERREMRKYKYIPQNSNDVSNFIILGDEFHQYLYGRFAMSNFSSPEGKRLLQTLHQVRHYNTLLILATQDIDELDVKLRSLAAYEIDTANYFGIFFGYSFFRYLVNRRKTRDKENEREFKKMSKFPILFLNTYALNVFIKDFERAYNRIGKAAFSWINHRFDKNYIWRKYTFRRFKTLDFESKFNVKLDKDIYQKGDLFRKLNEVYKKKVWQIGGNE